MIKKLEKAIQVMNKLFMVVAVILMLAIVAACALQVASRYIPGFRILSVEELARLAFIWMSYLGLSLAVASNDHPSMTVLQSRIPKSLVPAYHVVIQLFILAFSIVLLKYGIDKAFLMKKQVSTLLRVNMTFMYFSVVVGAAGSCINCVNNIILIIAKRSQDKIQPGGPSKETEGGDKQ